MSRTVVMTVTTEVDRYVRAELTSGEDVAVPSPDELRQLQENDDLLVDLPRGLLKAFVGGTFRTIGRIVDRDEPDYQEIRVAAV